MGSTNPFNVSLVGRYNFCPGARVQDNCLKEHFVRTFCVLVKSWEIRTIFDGLKNQVGTLFSDRPPC